MENVRPVRIKTISQYHRVLGLPEPEHPLISVIHIDQLEPLKESVNFIFDFYSISIKTALNTKFKYGQQECDFDEGVLFFISPNQVFGRELNKNIVKPSGWVLSIHPDFLWNTPLAKAIKHYEYFGYSANEALHLSKKEEMMLVNILKFIEQEYQSNIDNFTNSVIIAQIELLLSYSERFYHRQFLTRKKTNSQLLNRLEDLLTDYFNSDTVLKSGFPTVQYIAEKLHVSPNYLSGLLKVLTGQNTLQHIQGKVIEIAKQKLSTTELSIAEIAHELGFEHSQSFSRLFKAQTNMSPLSFRQSFN